MGTARRKFRIGGPDARVADLGGRQPGVHADRGVVTTHLPMTAAPAHSEGWGENRTGKVSSYAAFSPELHLTFPRVVLIMSSNKDPVCEESSRVGRLARVDAAG